MRWWRTTKRNADLERELRSDLALEEEEQRERGLSSEEAHYAALRAFGNPTLIREQTHATWSWNWLESLASDLKYGFRGMSRNAGSTLFAILIVGLGIGGASTVFSVVNALLLRPLPFRDPGQLVWISNGENYSTQAEHYADLRDQNHSFSDLAGWSGTYSSGDRELTGTGEPERLTSVPVTQNFFTLLGVEPAHWTIVYQGRVPGQVFRSARYAVELRLLAQAVSFRPECGGTEADVEQSAGDRRWCPAPVLRLRRRL